MIDVHVRVDEDTKENINSLAASRGITQAEAVRQVFREYFSSDFATKSLDVITTIVRSVIRSELKPVENRMAKISAKSAIAGATSMFLNIQTLDDLGKHDSVEMYQKARKKAVAYVKE